MKQATFAPWAEPVPGAPYPMTADDVLSLPDDGWFYELVEGRLIRMPMSGGEASRIAARLVVTLSLFVEPRHLGALLGADGGFNLTQPGETAETAETALGPDASFVRAERVPSPGSAEYGKLWHLAPDIAAEIVSPNQYRPEMEAKMRRYLAAGVRLVWLIWPQQRQVDVWRLGTDAPVATLGMGDALDGLDALPGLTYPVADLFA